MNYKDLLKVGDIITVKEYIGEKTFPYYRIDPVTRLPTGELQEFRVVSVPDGDVVVQAVREKVNPERDR